MSCVACELEFDSLCGANLDILSMFVSKGREMNGRKSSKCWTAIISEVVRQDSICMERVADTPKAKLR